MKTNQVLTRTMGTFKVLQRTKDGMFNATELLKQWNQSAGQKKSLDHFFENNSTKEFVETILSEANLDTRNSVYVKSRASRGDNAGTWMHPYLFIDFAMWLNPRFKFKVIQFVYDQLIKYRNEAGSAYREMSTAIASIVPKHEFKGRIQEVARNLNQIVYGHHSTGIRNTQAEESKARQLTELERDVTKLIDLGFISTFEQLKTYLRKVYKRNHINILN